MKAKKTTKQITGKYEISIQYDALDQDIRWIVCPHCRKPVYGTRQIKGAFLPNEQTMKTWTWEGPKYSKSKWSRKKSN